MKITGSLYIIISAFFYASYGVWSRIMGHHFGEFSQAWTRGLALLTIILLYQAKFKVFKPIKKKDWKWFAIIALTGLNQAPYYFGFQSLPIGTAIIIFYASLLLGGYFMGFTVFKEKVTLKKIISLILGIAGMAVIYSFSLSPDQFLGATLMTFAGFLGSIGGVLPKKLSFNYPKIQIMTGYLIVIVIVNSIVSLFYGGNLPPFSNLTPWLGQLGYTISYFIASFTVIEGFKRLDATTGSLIGLVEIIFGIIFGIFLFHESYGIGAIAGTTLIILSASLPNIRIKK